MTYVLEVSNHGPEPTFQAVLRQHIPAGTALVATSATRGRCDRLRAEVVCLLGELAPGAAATARVTVRVTRAAIGRVEVATTATVHPMDRGDGDDTNDTTRLVTPVVGAQ